MLSIMEVNEEDIESYEGRGRYSVAIVECGELGIPHAYLFGNAGFKVICANSNPHMLKQLTKIRKRYLEGERSEDVKREKSFAVTSSIREAVSTSEIIVISTETVIDKKGRPNYSSLEKTCKEVGMGLNRGSLVLFVTQTGPGIIEDIMCSILERTSGFETSKDFGLASSPAKVKFGKNFEVSDSVRVVGAIDSTSLKIARLLLSKIQSEIVEVSNIRTVEALGLFREAKNEANLAIANEFALMCEKFKIDFLEILKAAETSRIFSLPSPGLVADSIRRNYYLLLEESENANLSPRLMLVARKINDEIVDQIFRLIKEALKACGKTVRRAKVSVIGISQEPNCKVAPGALRRKLVNFLRKKVRTVQVYDPFFSKRELVELGFEADDLSRVVEGTDCVIVLVGHSRFERLNLKRVKLLAKKSPALVDVAHIIDPVRARKYGFMYRGLGRGEDGIQHE